EQGAFSTTSLVETHFAGSTIVGHGQVVRLEGRGARATGVHRIGLALDLPVMIAGRTGHEAEQGTIRAFALEGDPFGSIEVASLVPDVGRYPGGEVDHVDLPAVRLLVIAEGS